MAIFEMHEQVNLYGEISIVLGIFQSTCNNIVQSFDGKGSLRDRDLYGRFRILDELGNHVIVRMLND